MTKLEFIDKINDILIGLNTAESDALGSLYDELMRSQSISVKEELPKHDVEENGLITYPNVLVCLYDGYRTESYYNDIRGEWGDYDGEVEYWMPMPPAPGKEE